MLEAPLTLQYSSMGIRRLTATSRMWLRRNRIFPGAGDKGRSAQPPQPLCNPSDSLHAPFLPKAPDPPPKKPISSHRLNTSSESVKVARTFQERKEETVPSKLHLPGLSPVRERWGAAPIKAWHLTVRCCASLGWTKSLANAGRTSLVPLPRVPRSGVGTAKPEGFSLGSSWKPQCRDCSSESDL